ncbi:MAG: hypothetical protein OXF02_07850 [Simkaniaceae bacterium]|nr:hypothetical protein [Simkaniaceae bacterium]
MARRGSAWQIYNDRSPFLFFRIRSEIDINPSGNECGSTFSQTLFGKPLHHPIGNKALRIFFFFRLFTGREIGVVTQVCQPILSSLGALSGPKKTMTGMMVSKPGGSKTDNKVFTVPPG